MSPTRAQRAANLERWADDVDADDLRPLVELVVAEAIAQLDAKRALLEGRIGCVEAEAAPCYRASTTFPDWAGTECRSDQEGGRSAGLRRASEAGGKHEIRISKLETNPTHENSNSKPERPIHWCVQHLSDGRGRTDHGIFMLLRVTQCRL